MHQIWADPIHTYDHNTPGLRWILWVLGIRMTSAMVPALVLRSCNQLMWQKCLSFRYSLARIMLEVSLLKQTTVKYTWVPHTAIKTKIIVKRVSRITSAQPFQTHVNEVRCLLRLHHQHIVKLLGVFDGPANFLDIILEYCPLGALRNYVNEAEEPLGRNTAFPFYVSSLLVFPLFFSLEFRFLSNIVVPLVLNSTKSISRSPSGRDDYSKYFVMWLKLWLTFIASGLHIWM